MFQVTPSNWEYYDYSVMTTLAAFGPTIIPEMVCFAHARSVRVVANAPYPRAQLGNETYLQSQFIPSLILAVDGTETQGVQLDGINFDFEDPLVAGSADSAFLTHVVRETTSQMKAARGAGFQVSIDVAWSPNDIDGRGYDYPALIDAVDLAFVMAYDMRSQVPVNEPCIASANAPFPLVMQGMTNYTARIGAPASKLVLGLPWYGYIYQCIDDSPPDVNICPIAHVPFRNVSCSDAAGHELCYNDVSKLARNNATRAVAWNESLAAPFFDYVDATDGSTRQVWFDDSRSLGLKVALALAEGWRGVGTWNVDCLGYNTGDPDVDADNARMWATLSAIRG
jgi:di-N-acetylchitobiase